MPGPHEGFKTGEHLQAAGEGEKTEARRGRARADRLVCAKSHLAGCPRCALIPVQAQPGSPGTSSAAAVLEVETVLKKHLVGPEPARPAWGHSERWTS